MGDNTDNKWNIVEKKLHYVEWISECYDGRRDRGILTPYFHTENELDEWIKDHNISLETEYGMTSVYYYKRTLDLKEATKK